MAVRGAPGEIAVAHVDGVVGESSFEKSELLGRQLKAQSPDINMVYFLASGIDIANDRCIAGIESEITTVLVLSGVTSREDLKHFAYRPRYILNGVGDIVP